MAKMTEFDYDVRARKQLARMARYKKNGSKSKKCSLPSDGMTRKEWNERCGELMTFNMKKPMTWEQFKSMPHDLQKEYVTGLTTTYKVGLPKMADMLGCCEASLRNYIKRHIPDFVSGSTGGRMSKEAVVAWDAFLSGCVPAEGNPIAVEGAPEDSMSADEAVSANKMSSEKHDDVISTILTSKSHEENTSLPSPMNSTEEKKPVSRLREFSLVFDGDVNPMSIANSLMAILGGGAQGRIEVRYVM